MIRNYGIENRFHEYHTEELPSQDQVQICKEWLDQFAKKKRVKKDDCINSYGLKHIIENHVGQYITNGACIQAAIELGFEYWGNSGSVNANFYIQLLLPENEWQRLRPGGFSTWLFKQNTALAEDAKGDAKWPRKATHFADFWLYLRYKGDWVKESFCDAWEEWTGQPAPNPSLVDTELVYEQNCPFLKFNDPYPDANADESFLYALVEFKENSGRVLVRYIGQTNSPARRLKEHVLCPGTIEKLEWIASLINRNEYPQMAVFMTVAKEDIDLMEKAAMYAFSGDESSWDNKQERFAPFRDALLNKRF